MTSTANISELLANAGPELNDHVIALHHELAQLREVLRTTQAQMQAERDLVDRAGQTFAQVLDKRQQEIDSLREARRQLKARVRQLEEGEPIIVGRHLGPTDSDWGTHQIGNRPCRLLEVEAGYAWVLFHPEGRPRTRFASEVIERPT